MKCLLPPLLSLTSVAALAQTTGTVNPSSAPADASAKEDVPPGGCMPIGLTASGEIVFPIQCRELIERERGKTMEQKPVAVEQKPAAKQSESEDVTPVNSQGAIKRVETIAKRVEPKRREPAISGCRNFRTYDAATRTYTNYGGHRRPCR
jgi:hypothetical protein